MTPSKTAAQSRLSMLLRAEVSSRPLALVRIAVGLTIWEQFTGPWVGHRIDDVSGTALALAWIVLLGVWLVILGFWTRWATACVALAFALLHLYYGVHLGNSNLAAVVPQFQLLVLLAITSCGRSLSLDRVLEIRRARKQGRPPAPERVKWWQIDLFAIQIASMFLWIGVADTRTDWLSGAMLERDVVFWYGSDTFAAHPDLPSLLPVAAWIVVIAEFALVPLLLIRRLRLYGMGLGFVLLFLHLLLMVHNFDILYAILILIVPLVACVPPDRFHALVSDQAAHVAPDESSTQAPQRPAHTALAALALVTMVLWSNVPPYRGHVLEEPRGFFSWPAWALHTPTRHSACDLRYYDMNRQNAIVERWKLLGYDHPGAVPKKLARVAKSNIEASNVQVCRSLRKAGDNPPKVKLFARCLVRDEWVKVYGAGSNLCSPAKTPNK